MTPPTIAITGVGAVIGYGVVRAIRKSRLYKNSTIIGLDTDPDSAGFTWSDRCFIPPKIGNEDYVKTVISVCKKENVDIFIPLIEDEFIPVHEALPQFKAIGTTVLMQPRPIVEGFLDKYLTYTILARSGIATPETIPLVPENDCSVEKMTERCGWPLILKPRFGRSSKGVTLISTSRQLELYEELFKDKEYVIQEYVGDDNREYTCTIFSVPLMELPYCIILERELAYGSTIKAQVIHDESLYELCKSIPSAFPIEGSLNVQIRKKEGKPHIFEINPRYSSTSYIRALCGFNDVEMGLEYFLKGKIPSAPKIKDHRFVRYLNEIILPSGREEEHDSGSRTYRSY